MDIELGLEPALLRDHDGSRSVRCELRDVKYYSTPAGWSVVYQSAPPCRSEPDVRVELYLDEVVSDPGWLAAQLTLELSRAP